MTIVFDERAAESSLVEKIWYGRSEAPGQFISTAAINWEIVVAIYQGQTLLTVRGPETKASHADYPEGAEFFGIIFRLGTHMPHLPLLERLNRQDFPLPEATSQRFWLHGSAWQYPTYDNADVFVNRLIQQNLIVADPVVEAVLAARPLTLSLRSVQRRFVQVTGLTHKTIQQIQRAQLATELLTTGTPILEAAFEAGYYDQSHMTNALVQYMGQTPAQLLRVQESALLEFT
ncbi:MAG: helix-turn-helix domain-containing protein [Anaerolineae bacterium]